MSKPKARRSPTMTPQPKTEVTREVCDLKTERIQDALERDKERLDKHSEMLDTISQCNVTLTQLLKNHESRLADHHTRLDSLERRPGSLWDRLLGAFISAAVAALVAFLTA